MLHLWVALPLIEAAQSEDAVLQLVAPSMPVLARLWADDGWAAKLRADQACLSAELVRRRAVFDWMRSVVSRVSPAHLEPGGRLLLAAGDAPPDKLKQQMVKVSAKAAKEAVDIPGMRQAVSETDAGAGSVATLRRALHAAAYGAFCEIVLRTQSKADIVNKLLFNFSGLWRNTVDPEARYELGSTTDFGTTSVGAAVAAGAASADGGSRPRAPTGAGYLPSQALAFSSLSQDASGAAGGAPGSSFTIGGAVAADRASQASQAAQGASQGYGAETGDVGGGGVAAGEASDGWAGGSEGDIGAGLALEGEFDLDDLNEHPVVRVLMRSIGQLRARGLEAEAERGMPAWMGKLLDTLADNSTSYSVRLLVAKLVYNLRDTPGATAEPPHAAQAAGAAAKPKATDAADANPPPPTLFGEHSRHWFKPLSRLVLESLLASDKFNYLARDLLTLMASWPADQLPVDDPELHALLAHVLERAMARCGDDLSDVARQNVRAVRAMLELAAPRLGGKLQVRRLVLLKMIKAGKGDDKQEVRTGTTGLHLLNAVMRNGLAYADDGGTTAMAGGHCRHMVTANSPAHGTCGAIPAATYIPATPDQMHKALFACLQHRLKSVHSVAALVLGEVLAQMSGGEAGGGAGAELRAGRGTGVACGGAGAPSAAAASGGLPPLAAAVGGDVASHLLPGFEREIQRHLYKSATSDFTQANIGKLLVLLDGLSAGFPRLLDLNRRQLGAWVKQRLNSVHGDARVAALRCLQHAARRERAIGQGLVDEPPPLDGAADAEPVTRLSVEQWGSILSQQQVEVQRAALDLLGEIVHMRPPQELYPLLQTLDAAVARHRDLECRASYQDILIILRRRATESGAAVEPASEALLRTGLLLGLRDPDSGRRASMLAYWHAQLPSGAADRLVACFDELYTPAVESHWLHSSAVLLLELVRAAPNYVTPVFDQSLEEGLAMQVVELAPTYGSASAAMQPWGASFFTQSQAEGGEQLAGVLRTTQPLVFSMTQSQQVGGPGHASTYSSQPTGAPPAGPRGRAAPPPVPGFGASQGSQSETSGARGPAFADQAPIKRRAAAAAGGGRRRASAVAAARGSQPVVAMRSYRAGEIPDIALTPHDFFAPLSALAQHDPLVAKRTLVHLYQAIRTQRMAEGGGASLARLHAGVGKLLGSRAGSPAFVACLHELALTEEDTSGWLEPDLVASSGLRIGTVHSAVRLLEAQLVAAPAAPRPAKRARAAGGEGGGGDGAASPGAAPPRNSIWTLLLDLYRALGEEDIVRGLAAEVASSEHLRSALAAEARGDSEAALELYEGALGSMGEDGVSPEAEQLAQRGRRECLLQLGKWEELRDASEQLLAAANSELGSWREAAHEPWLRMLLVSAAKAGQPEAGWRSWRPASEGSTGGQDGWPHPDRDKDLMLELGLGSLLVLERLASGSEGGARALLPEAVSAFIGRWATLHPQAASARLAELPQLQLLAEAGELLAALQQPLLVEESIGSFRLSDAVGGLLRSWDGRFPSASRHGASVWDDLVCSRQLMLSVLRRKLHSEAQRAEQDERGQLEARVELAAAHSLLTAHTRAAAAVRAQGDFEPAKQHVIAAIQIRRKHPGQLPSADLSHNVGLLRHGMQKSLARQGLHGSVQVIRDLWAQASKVAATGADATQRAELCELRADIAKQLLAAGHDEAPGMLAEARQALDGLLAEAPSGELTAARLKLVDLCVSELRRPSRSPSASDSAVARTAVRQVALAMAAGSLAARDRLPTAVALLRTRPEAWDEASELLSRPPAWMALKWTSQLLAVLHEPHGEAVAKLIQRLAEAYPSMLYHPSALSRPTLEQRPGLGPRAKACVDQLGALLRSRHLEALADAFEDLTHPNLRLKDAMDGVVGLLREGKVDAAAKAYVGGTAWMRGGSRGRLLTKFAEFALGKVDALCGSSGEKLGGFAGAAATTLVRQVNEQAGTWRQFVGVWEQKHAAEREQLSTFSPFLATYHAADEAHCGPLDALELPAASDVDADPSRQGRVVAHSFGGSLPTMESLRRPKRLTVHGSDARERRYLVKGGEDLRQDQRVQQLFRVINSVLAADGQCAARGLGMRTYAVLPLNDRVGLIEWVNGTNTLQGLIKRTDRAAASVVGRGRAPASGMDQADARFREESTKPAKGLPRWLAMPSREAVGMLDRAHAAVPADLLARGLLSLSVGAEAMLAVRSAFARSLAALTIAGHVLGIGDRHLDNFLVEEATGRVVGIDFGHAFGSATYLLPQPELMGVRLTRQITSVLRPLDAGVLIKAQMSHVLRALRSARDELLRVMDVFISEPQIDWAKHAKKLSAEQRKQVEGAGGTEGSGGPAGSDAADGEAGGGGSTEQAGSGSADAAEAAWVRSRLASVEAKLRGDSSAHVTLSEVLLTTHRSLATEQAQAALKEVVMGLPNSIRRSLPATGLTPEQQVDVLVEQATDPNILARTYFGWKPWL